jgi:hypothetical protein
MNVRLADAVRANFAYLAGALASDMHDDAELEALRRAAGLASKRAEGASRCVNLERLKGCNVSEIEVFGLLRRISGTATRLRLAPPHPERNNRLADWVLSDSRAVQVDLRGAPGSSRCLCHNRSRLDRWSWT